MEEVAEVMRAGMVGETTQSRWKARAAADAAGGSGVVVYVGKDEMGGKVDASEGSEWDGRIPRKSFFYNLLGPTTPIWVDFWIFSDDWVIPGARAIEAF